ncbi:uncharacterized protein LOC141649815 [Silene latifolia]|uniref:uncharacterized protein LOC141649815 n=1 Tax=Silene latifolia TaxID=37657 RepID=UPI003D777AE7
MNILFWNCRGIAKPSFTTHLSYLINAHKPNIVILSETRTNSPNSVTIVRKLPFDSWEILDPVGFTGGIIILWNARDVAISLVDKGSQMINVVAQDLNRVLDSENLYWQDRARVNWLIDGDRNTAFFQKSVTLRRSFNRIISLVDEVGHTISGNDDLAVHITDFFNTLYTTDKTSTNRATHISPSPITSHTIPSEDEIRLALFSLGSKKAPGPDGFHAGFYKNCWHIVKIDLIPFIQRIFLLKCVPECINKTAISLIPKIPSPQTIRNFRPISLCNTSYKIITKIIVNRLKPFMHKIISPNQGSSIPDRGTDTNFIIASEILHSMHTSKCKLGWFALKLDLEKAFDRLEWDFIRLCLFNAKIDNDTISLIMHCISSSSTQVALNGTLLPSFLPSRGIRQGDPLSPYLFILCMEALSTLIHQSRDDFDWSPFPLGKGGASFSHLLFADDILLFGRASEKNLCAVQDTLHTFCSSSGQKINFSKSKLLFSKHTSPAHINMFETALGIKATSNLSTYLGFPLKGTKPKKVDLRHIVDAIQSKLSSWKANFLSKAGRLCLINSTISAIPSHSMQCIRLPSSILGDIDKITKSFLWSGSSSKKLHLSNWDLVTLPLSHGGLGIKAARPLNDAYSIKLSWNLLLNKNSLASTAIHSKYPTHSSYSFLKGSHIWKNVGLGFPLLRDHTIWSIGDGDSICLWTDYWSSLGPLRKIIHGPLSATSSKTKLKTIISNGTWALDNLDFVLPTDFLNTILVIPLPSACKPDLLTTSLAPKDKFSIGSAYSSLINLSNHPPSLTPTLDWIWDLPTLPKIKFFLWLVWWDKLPHNKTLFKRTILPSPTCLLCPSPSLEESSIHILRDCSTATSVWALLNVDQSFFSLDLQPWIHANCTSRNPSWVTLFSFVLWRLWAQRCDFTFNATPPPRPPHLFRDATSNLAQSWTFASSPSLPPSSPGSTSASYYPCSWALPLLCWFKINVDAAFSPLDSLACIGCVVRNDIGSWVRGWSRRLLAPSPFVGEVLAIREGLRAGLASMDRFIIASDCLNAVTSILSKAQPCGQFANVILECRDLLDSSPRLKIVFEKRSANAVADALAKAGVVDSSSSNGCINWDVAPPFVLRLCTSDFIGLGGICIEKNLKRLGLDKDGKIHHRRRRSHRIGSGEATEKTIEKAGDRNVTVDSAPQKATPTELVAEGERIYKRLGKWSRLAASLIMEQEKAAAQSGPLIAKLKLDLSAARGEAGKAKLDLRVAEKRAEEAEKLLKAERAKAEEAAKEAIRRLDPDGTFPWDKYDQLLDEIAEAAEAAAAEKAEAAKAAQIALAKAAYGAKEAEKEAERQKVPENVEPSLEPATVDAAASDGGKQQA